MTLPPPLLARFRRRLTTMVRLLAFVVLAKGALFSLCVGDGLASGQMRSNAVLMTASAASAFSDVDESGATSCWHDGSDSCHCTCAHATALPAIASSWGAAPASSTRIALPAVSPHYILLPPALRPPIA
jgi:hypothetical protein